MFSSCWFVLSTFACQNWHCQERLTCVLIWLVSLSTLSCIVCWSACLHSYFSLSVCIFWLICLSTIVCWFACLHWHCQKAAHMCFDQVGFFVCTVIHCLFHCLLICLSTWPFSREAYMWIATGQLSDKRRRWPLIHRRTRESCTTSPLERVKD